MRCVLLLLPFLLAGCDEPLPARPDPAPHPALVTAQDPGRCGRVLGAVEWQGAVPVVPPMESVGNPLDYFGGPGNPVRPWPNPNTPRVADGRLAGAFVWLEGVEPHRARPWKPTPTTVEMKARQFSASRGLARVGDELAVVSRDRVYHSLQARGACRFGLTLPEAGAVRRRRLDAAGVVELRSGAGMFWMRSYLLVQPHPYMAVSDEQGRFSFDEVPEGSYRLVAWHPGWKVDSRERHPDTLRVFQITFADGLRVERAAEVTPGRAVEIRVGLGGGP